MLPLKAELRKAIGKDVGQTIKVSLKRASLRCKTLSEAVF